MNLRFLFHVNGHPVRFTLSTLPFPGSYVTTLKDVIPVKFAENCKQFKVTPEQWLRAAHEAPKLFVIPPKTLAHNVNGQADLLGVDRRIYLERIALRQPSLFLFPPAAVDSNLKATIKVIGNGLTKKEYIELAMSHPALLCHSPETIANNIKRSAERLNISVEEYVKAAKRQPTLFSLTPKKVNDNIKKTAKLLKVKKRFIVNAAVKTPSIFGQSPSTLNRNIKGAAGLLGIPKRRYLMSALSLPSLITMLPETVAAHIEGAVEILGVKRGLYIRTALNKAPLFARKPESIQINSITLQPLILKAPGTDEYWNSLLRNLSYSPERNIMHMFASNLTGNNTKINRNPQAYIKRFYEQLGQVSLGNEVLGVMNAFLHEFKRLRSSLLLELETETAISDDFRRSLNFIAYSLLFPTIKDAEKAAHKKPALLDRKPVEIFMHSVARAITKKRPYLDTDAMLVIERYMRKKKSLIAWYEAKRAFAGIDMVFDTFDKVLRVRV